MSMHRKRALRIGTRGAAIRGFCVGCCGGSLKDVRNCPSKDCLLWPFRMGKREELEP